MADTTDALLEEILAELEEGREPDEARLVARHPGQEEEIGRLIRVALAYRSSARSLEKEGVESVLHAGDRLGDFEVVRLVGKGGMGEVYRARQLSLGGREVALKVLPETLQGEVSLARFRREGVLLASLHHPNLAEVYGFGEERGLAFIAMRFVEGETLRAVQERLRAAGKVPAGPALRRRVVRWAADVAEALALVHENGFVHRDVKPSNVIVQTGNADRESPPDGKAVLVDFGLVREFGADTMTRTTGSPATPDYAAPEQLLGADVTPRTDVFALGVTLHDLLSGRSPSERQRASLGLERLDELVDGIDVDLASVVARAADPDARWRYANGSELHRDLRAWLDGRAVSARRRPMHERLRRGLVENPARIGRIGIAAGLLLIAVLVVARAGRHVAAADRASHAFARGDLQELAEASSEIPSALLGLFLDDGLESLARRTRSAEEGDPLRPILDCLRADDASGALLSAATHLRLRGLEADSHVRWYFERTLRNVLEDPAENPRLCSDAIRLTARLFCERPCETPEELAANAEFRRLARSAWQDEDLPEIDRLYALSALAGCGSGGDLAPMLAWALEDSATVEQQRLGMAVSLWIVWRSADCRELNAIDFAAANEAFGRQLGRILTTKPEEWWGVRTTHLDVFATRSLFPPLASAERAATGRPSALVAAIPDTWIRKLEHSPLRHRAGLWTLAVCGDPRAREYLLRGPPSLGDELQQYWTWGRWAAHAGDDLFVDRVRAHCVELAASGSSPDMLVAEFDRGRGEVRSEAGIPGLYRLDPDTLLGFEPESSELEAIPLRRADAPLPRGSAIARWDFCGDDTTAAGCAVAASGCAGGITSDHRGRPYLRLARSGSSRVHLDFEIAEDEVELLVQSRPVLALVHLAARRDHLPYHGSAFVELSVNGFLVRGRMAAPTHYFEADRPQEIEIPADLIRSGRNVVVLRLHQDTTTTYRLLSAELRLRD